MLLVVLSRPAKCKQGRSSYPEQPPLSNPTRWSLVQDDEAELLAELARIRKEREQEAAKKAADEALQKQAALQEEVIHGNPLFPRGQPDFQVCLMRI